MNSRQNHLSDRLRKSLLLRLVISLVLYTVLGIVIYVLAINMYHRRIWYGEELLYIIVKWFDSRREFFALSYIVVGYVAIFLYYWKKPFSYIQEVASAVDQIYQRDNMLIELSEELKDIEFKMNQTKLDIQENERFAKDAEQRKNDLVVYLAHDLKTPLTSVIGYITLLRDENKISEELREKYLSISLDKAERLEYLINEFFEITRFNLSNITLEKSQVNLTRMLEQLTYEFKPMLEEKGLHCKLNVASELKIKCDVDKMQRVFDNLLRNAVNYSFEESTIDITVLQDDNGVKITFLNHGNTIPEEKLQRIFEQFYRLDTSRTTKSGGAGLGLAIAKEIVELHGGSITARSQNEFVIFELTLPAL